MAKLKPCSKMDCFSAKKIGTAYFDSGATYYFFFDRSSFDTYERTQRIEVHEVLAEFPFENSAYPMSIFPVHSVYGR